jgi:hypothetical protein
MALQLPNKALYHCLAATLTHFVLQMIKGVWSLVAIAG